MLPQIAARFKPGPPVIRNPHVLRRNPSLAGADLGDSVRAMNDEAIRVLIIPGLHGSEDGHWQTWLQWRFRGSRRVEQADPHTPSLPAWSERVAEVVAREPATRWVAVAHSFGCLALARHLATRGGDEIAAVLMVAPAEPAKFGLEALLPRSPLGLPGRLLASETDPWMTLDSARRWADRWGLPLTNLGDVGHINTASGFGPLPIAQRLTQRCIHRLRRERRLQGLSTAITQAAALQASPAR